MPWNTFATGVAVIFGALAAPLVVTTVAGVIVAGSTATTVTLAAASFAGPAVGVVGLSAAETAIVSAVGGVIGGVISMIASKDDDRRCPSANTTEVTEQREGFDRGNDSNIINATDAKEVAAFYRQQASEAKRD
ncbi:hypothetical protein BGZ89_005033 [Linnemannia elongata]|nr:hypothetical protein BGZ89_005033 [Linnemannia elongata]